MQSIQGSSDAGQQSGMCRKNVIPLLVSVAQCGMNEPFPGMVLYNLLWAAHSQQKAGGCQRAQGAPVSC